MPVDWGARLVETGGRILGRVGAALDEADPEVTIRPASRLLCAGLAELAACAWRARRIGQPPVEGLEAAALLSLLTKLDDQVIDSLDFHGGAATERGALRRRTDAWLAPTLASIRGGVAAEPSPRCALAARLGRAVVGLCPDPARRVRLLDLVARGWAIQTEAVVVLTAHPAQVTLRQVDVVTADISGAWLSMIALVGLLPPDTGPWPDADELAALFDWGLWIQRADALSDLDKDLAEGLIATSPGWRAWRADPAGFDAALAADEPGAMHRLFAATDADLACLPMPATLDRLAERLGSLGELAALLRWIHGFLLARYAASPLCARRSGHHRFTPLLAALSSWQTADGRSSCSGP